MLILELYCDQARAMQLHHLSITYRTLAPPLPVTMSPSPPPRLYFSVAPYSTVRFLCRDVWVILFRLRFITTWWWKKISLAWTSETNGHQHIPRPALHWKVPGFKRGPGRPCTNWRNSQQGLVKDGNHLGGSRGGSSKQIRMASECGQMHPLGCGLN